MAVKARILVFLRVERGTLSIETHECRAPTRWVRNWGALKRNPKIEASVESQVSKSARPGAPGVPRVR